MRFKLNGPIGEGREIEFDQDTLTVKEARLLKKVTGYGLRAFGEGMREGDVDALMGMVYIAMRREGVVIPWRQLDDFNINDLDVVTDDAEEAAQLEAAKAEVIDGEVVAAAATDEFGSGLDDDDDPAVRGEGAAVTELRPTPPPASEGETGRPRRRAASR